MFSPPFHAFPAEEPLLLRLTALVAEYLSTAVQRDGGATLVVSGGRTPVTLFQRLSDSDLPWSRVTVTLADERWVPTDSPASNENLLRTHLLVGRAAAARFIPLKSSAASARGGQEGLCRRLAGLPRLFTLVLLGMGEDGHTASWFPGADTLEEALCPPDERPCQWVSPPAAEHDRLTLTLPRLLATEHLILFFRGAEKRALYQRVLAEPDQPAVRLRYPVANVLFQQGTPVAVFWSP